CKGGKKRAGAKQGRFGGLARPVSPDRRPRRVAAARSLSWALAERGWASARPDWLLSESEDGRRPDHSHHRQLAAAGFLALLPDPDLRHAQRGAPALPDPRLF